MGSTFISSALVSPKTALALVRALQTVPNPFCFRIPTEDDDLQIDEAPYHLIGWLAANSSETCFDDHDPLRHQTRPLPRMPGRAVRKTLGLKRDNGPHARWIAVKDGQPSFVSEIWSDLPEREDDRLPRPKGSNGWRLWMRPCDLHTFLEEAGMDLIYEVQIKRRIHGEFSRSYDPDPRKNKIFDQILLYQRDGRIAKAPRNLSALGRHIVEEFQLESGVNTPGRWMAHHLAELRMQVKEAKDPAERTKAMDQAMQTFLRLQQLCQDNTSDSF